MLFNADTGKLACGTTPGCDLPNTTPWYHSTKTNFGPRLGISVVAREASTNKTVFRIGAGYYYGPGQTEDQVQPIDSDRASRTLTSNIAWPINPAQVLAGYNINDPNLGFQPRAYGNGYTLPEKVLSYTASIQQELPGNAVLTVAYVGSQGRNLFLRSWTNGIVGVTTNPTTGAGNADPAVRPALRPDRLQDQRRHRPLRLAADHAEPPIQQGADGRACNGPTATASATPAAPTKRRPRRIPSTSGRIAATMRSTCGTASMSRCSTSFRSRRKSKAANFLSGGWEVGGIYNGRTGLPIDVTISRPDIVYQINGTNQFVQAPIVTNGVVTTTAVIDNPYGGAFRSNRRPTVVPGRGSVPAARATSASS